MHELDIARYSNAIDPHLHVWGWEIPVYLFLGGMAAGIMILGALLRPARAGDGAPPPATSRALRWLAFAPAVLVSIGMGALFLDLAHKLHAWRFYLAFRWTSPMSWGAWILVVVYPVSLLFALAGLEDGEALRAASWAGARFAPAGRALVRARAFAVERAGCLRRAQLVSGAALGVYTGVLLSTLGARALWSSALLGPLFLVSGFSSGAALVLLFRLSDGERALVARWDRIALGLELVVLALFLAGLASGGADARGGAALLLGGPFTAPFFLLVVFGGLAIPLLLGTLEHRLHLAGTAVAPALVLAGGLALRAILVAAGQV